MEYTVYNTSTGIIHTHGSIQGATDLSVILINDEDSIIEGFVDRVTHKIVDGVATEYTPDVMPILRNKRDGLLADSDWTQMSDSPLSSSKKTEWATYRQALRDLPATSSATEEADVIWPTKPA